MAVNIATTGMLLCHATVIRYLGLYINQHLTWQHHIDHVVSKARTRLYRIRHLHLSAYSFGLMYQVFIIPLFDYCDVVWTPCLAKQLGRAMECTQSKVTSTVQHSRDRLSSCFFHIENSTPWTNKQWSKLFKGALKSRVNHLKRLEVKGQGGMLAS